MLLIRSVYIETDWHLLFRSDCLSPHYKAAFYVPAACGKAGGACKQSKKEIYAKTSERHPKIDLVSSHLR